jgi:hypothetical protein
MRLIVEWLNPVLAANMRLDQCVAPFGVFSSASRTTCSIFSSPISSRHSETRLISQPNHSFGDETVAPKAYGETGGAQLRRHRCVAAPPAHFRTMRARKATDWAPRDCLAMRSNSARCAWFTTSDCFFGRPRKTPYLNIECFTRI